MNNFKMSGNRWNPIVYENTMARAKKNQINLKNTKPQNRLQYTFANH